MKDCQSVILVAAAIVPSCNVAADASSSCGSVKQLQSSHHVDYFVTLRISSKTNKKMFWITAVWRSLTQMCQWSWPQRLPGAGHFQSLMILGRNKCCWYWVLQCESVTARTAGCVFVIDMGWGLELVLNSISGNDVVVDSVQHCQPSCLSSVLKGGPL